eukprot:6199579-Pleurochrysis_carterae.AAC.5
MSGSYYMYIPQSDQCRENLVTATGTATQAVLSPMWHTRQEIIGTRYSFTEYSALPNPSYSDKKDFTRLVAIHNPHNAPTVATLRA